MISIKGFTIKEQIHSGGKSIVYRGDNNGKPVIVKILNNKYPDISEVNSFKKEYNVLEKINSQGIVKALGIEKYDNSIAIVFEDIGGEALSKLSNEIKSFSLIELMRIMLMSAKSLGEVHALNLVHKDIKSHNIVLNRKAGRLQIIDFGNASQLAKQNSYTPLNSSIEGTLAYVSPEQTGRMNRSVDYRTDYYSLGVTFYQILTGEVPFTTSDPMELVHSHIAKRPLSPFEKNKTPKILSDIVMKLLEKNPEDRYQSIAGLVYDLEWCLNNIDLLEFAVRDTPVGDAPVGDAYMRHLRGDNFKIGTHDHSGKFQIPEKLYGRNEEVIQIIKTFKRVVEGNTELLLISGRSGIGKSALINEVNKPITEYRGIFASGKYDQFKKTIPYRAITQCFQSLLQQILMSSQSEIPLWKEKILKALGLNGKIIADVIPELEILIGEQPSVTELGPTESQNRFNMVFQNFIQAFSSKDHPTALFLDDMQWADNSSIHLIHSILSNTDIKHLLLMLSFRDNEVLPTDPFSLMIESVKKNGLVYREILLEPIKVNDIRHLVSDTLNCEEGKATEIAEIISNKTKGNPFFVNQMFKSFYDKDLIVYKDGIWIWDVSSIQKVNIGDNVIDLMIEKVSELPESLIDIIKLAACIGDWFLIDIFSEISKKPKAELTIELIEISNEGFFIIAENIVRFVHDKIREAAYSLISEADKDKNHYAIGSTYLKMTKEEDIEENVFTIVNQLNHGIEYIVDPEEKVKLLELNRIAGNKSVTSNAYEAGIVFFQSAMNSLPVNAWEDKYDLTLELYTSRARAEYLSKDYVNAEKTFCLILENAKAPLDKIPVYELQSSMYVSQNKMIEAINSLKQALRGLGIRLPKKATQVSPLPEIIKFKFKFGKRKTEDLLNLALMKDKKALAIMRLLNALIAPAFLAEPALFPVLVTKMVNLSLREGNSPLTPFAYAAFGIIQGSALGDFEIGHQFGKLAIDLIGKIGKETNSIECRTYFLFATMINHWKLHASKNKEYYTHALEKGIHSGDLQYSSYALNNSFFQGIMMRQDLNSLSESFLKYHKSIASLQQYNAYQLYQLNEQTVLNFKGVSMHNTLLIGKYFDETKVLPEWLNSQNANALFDFYLSKSRLEYILGDINKAYEYSSLAAPYEAAMFGMMFVPEHVFFDSLICARLYLQTSDKKKQKEYRKRLYKNYKRMKKWGENCEANYGHKSQIIEGLIERIEGNSDKSLELLSLAIELAKKHEYLLEEALANEFMADIWLERGKDKYADLHLFDAHYTYKKWGCEPKGKQLEEKFPQLKRSTLHGFTKDMSVSSSSTASPSGVGTFLDLNTVMKASQAISGEIQLGKLLERMMNILFENAGAERGIFILRENDKWFIQAEGNANTGTITVLQNKELEGYSGLSTSIVNYVVRTKSVVLLSDATKKGLFVNDAYVKRREPKSILCYPILTQGNLIGVVYLENNLTTDAFTPDRIEILKVLSSQIAVSVENSLLYANLEEKVEARTRDLNNALVEVRGLKEQQDGDYFLNTLLIEPLAQNNAFSKNVNVTFFSRQKKSFVFRKSEYELGGDINISENIELEGKKYIVFLNGDAMGKSIQGAGGVLVLGTVFKSIIQRTISTDYGKSIYPERWLKNAFIEMHKAFESFDGSMLMSAAFGLIDEKTGTMYFMNAEHPDIVLYRDGIANFIENTIHYRKLGTQGQTGNISIQIFSLRQDDVIILGSDGRDDLVLGKESGSEYDIINQDERLFLRHVKNADGDLEKIFEEIQSTGKLMDDLSLLRIHFKGQSKDQKKLDEDLLLLEEHKQKKEFDKLITLGETLISDYPHLTNSILEMAYAFQKIGHYHRAVDFGERIRLRDPENTLNLVNLIESYTKIGKRDFAKSILEASLKIKPHDQNLKKLKEELK